MNRQRLLDTLWAGDLVVGLLPVFVALSAGVGSYVLVAPILISHLSEALRTFLVLSSMVIGGVLGLAGIGLTLRPERLRKVPA